MVETLRNRPENIHLIMTGRNADEGARGIADAINAILDKIKEWAEKCRAALGDRTEESSNG